MPPISTQGTVNPALSETASAASMFRESTTPSSTLESTPIPTMNAVSTRNESETSPRWNPIARSTPICCRRSTTERNAITPTAAMPTNNPSPMNPCTR